MAAANAAIRYKKLTEKPEGEESDTGSLSSHGSVEEEKSSLLASQSASINRSSSLPKIQYKQYSEITEIPSKTRRDHFDITQRIEMGQMASMFFSRAGVHLFYACIVIYLYGDLAIYAAAVPTSLRDVVCYSNQGNSNTNLSENHPCWNSKNLTRIDVYRIFLGVFTVTLVPFVFFNVQKTKYLQIFTSLMRWLAFSVMIILALIHVSKGKGAGQPKAFIFSGIPNLFGVCIYSFMCQHSLPSLVTPIKNKSRLSTLFFGDFTVILMFYLVLSFTAVFCFDNSQLKDLYTLNFSDSAVCSVVAIQYFLALFPVFTLSTNFPIIAITLRNNLKTMFHREGKKCPWMVDQIIYPMITVLPPIGVAFYTHDLEFLVGITGSYAGVGIQYLTPACLVYYARKHIDRCYGKRLENKHASLFKHKIWVFFILIWAVACVIFVTVNHIVSRK
uniref:Transmembrane protein 104-like n=1 Tax=Saccoglossus kowalevskii TaxID=10224 RepID=A0ABM0M3Z7_SACKO|nr:PREDICTED: transmembrane protein 104-like [Saccoglossus kowalevskii]